MEIRVGSHLGAEAAINDENSTGPNPQTRTRKDRSENRRNRETRTQRPEIKTTKRGGKAGHGETRTCYPARWGNDRRRGNGTDRRTRRGSRGEGNIGTTVNPLRRRRKSTEGETTGDVNLVMRLGRKGAMLILTASVVAPSPTEAIPSTTRETPEDTIWITIDQTGRHEP